VADSLKGLPNRDTSQRQGEFAGALGNAA